MLGSTSMLVLSITPAMFSACYVSSFSWDRCARPFRRAINSFKAKKLLAGTTAHISGAGLGSGSRNGGAFVFFCSTEPKAVSYSRNTILLRISLVPTVLKFSSVSYNMKFI